MNKKPIVTKCIFSKVTSYLKIMTKKNDIAKVYYASIMSKSYVSLLFLVQTKQTSP